jgi:hypothetical protein
MTLTYLPATQANAAMQAMVVNGTTYYLSLHTATPGNTGASEASGGTGPYARQSIVMGAAASGTETSTTAQNFTGMPAVTVGWFGFWSLVSSGTYELGGALTSSLTVPAGATVAFAIGAVTLTIGG